MIYTIFWVTWFIVGAGVGIYFLRFINKTYHDFSTKEKIAAAYMFFACIVCGFISIFWVVGICLNNRQNK